MFLELLNDKQQQVFLDAAVTMASADGHLHLDETAFLERVKRESGGTLGTASHLPHREVISRAHKAFADTGVASRALLVELAGLVIADGERTDAELELLREIANAVGVPEADVPVFLDFAQRAEDLLEDARDLLAASNVEV
jgi:tellurite resistance protein